MPISKIKDQKSKIKRGEIGTVVMMAVLVVVSVIAFGSSNFSAKKQTINTQAAAVSCENSPYNCGSNLGKVNADYCGGIVACGQVGWGPADICYRCVGANCLRGGSTVLDYPANSALSDNALCCIASPNSTRLCCDNSITRQSIISHLGSDNSLITSFKQKADARGLTCAQCIVDAVGTGATDCSNASSSTPTPVKTSTPTPTITTGAPTSTKTPTPVKTSTPVPTKTPTPTPVPCTYLSGAQGLTCQSGTLNAGRTYSYYRYENTACLSNQANLCYGITSTSCTAYSWIGLTNLRCGSTYPTLPPPSLTPKPTLTPTKILSSTPTPTLVSGLTGSTGSTTPVKKACTMGTCYYDPGVFYSKCPTGQKQVEGISCYDNFVDAGWQTGNCCDIAPTRVPAVNTCQGYDCKSACNGEQYFFSKTPAKTVFWKNNYGWYDSCEDTTNTSAYGLCGCTNEPTQTPSEMKVMNIIVNNTSGVCDNGVSINKNMLEINNQELSYDKVVISNQGSKTFIFQFEYSETVPTVKLKGSNTWCLSTKPGQSRTLSDLGPYQATLIDGEYYVTIDF